MQHEAAIRNVRQESYQRLDEVFFSYDFEVFVACTEAIKDRIITAVLVNGKRFHKFKEPVRLESEEGALLRFNNVPAEYFNAKGPEVATVETN